MFGIFVLCILWNLSVFRKNIPGFYFRYNLASETKLFQFWTLKKTRSDLLYNRREPKFSLAECSQFCVEESLKVQSNLSLSVIIQSRTMMHKSPFHWQRNLETDLNDSFYIFIVFPKQRPSLYLQENDARHRRYLCCQYGEEVSGSKQTSEDLKAVPTFHHWCKRKSLMAKADKAEVKRHVFSQSQHVWELLPWR